MISAGSRSSIGIAAPVGRREVDGRGRRDDVERDPVVAGEHRERVRADLVRRVAVRGDPVGAGDDAVDLAGRHQRRGGRVGDHGVRDRRRLELPRGQPRALQERPRLVDPDVREQPRSQAVEQRADGAAVAAGREPAGVAVRQRARARARRARRRERAICRQRSTSSAWIRRACSAVGSSSIRSSAQPRFTAVGRDRAEHRVGRAEVLARARPRARSRTRRRRRSPARRARPSSRIASATSAARPALDLDLVERQPPLVEQDDAVGSRGGGSAQARACARRRRSGALVPRREVLRLLVGERVDRRRPSSRA